MLYGLRHGVASCFVKHSQYRIFILASSSCPGKSHLQPRSITSKISFHLYLNQNRRHVSKQRTDIWPTWIHFHSRKWWPKNLDEWLLKECVNLILRPSCKPVRNLSCGYLRVRAKSCLHLWTEAPNVNTWTASSAGREKAHIYRLVTKESNHLKEKVVRGAALLYRRL